MFQVATDGGCVRSWGVVVESGTVHLTRVQVLSIRLVPVGRPQSKRLSQYDSHNRSSQLNLPLVSWKVLCYIVFFLVRAGSAVRGMGVVVVVSGSNRSLRVMVIVAVSGYFSCWDDGRASFPGDEDLIR